MPRSSANQRCLSVVPGRPIKVAKSQNLTNFDKLQVINIYRSLPPKTPYVRAILTIHEYGYTTMVKSTLSRLLRAEHRIRAYVAVDPRRLYEKRMPVLKLPEVDAATAQWVIQTLSSPRARISGEMICEEAHEFCQLLGFPVDTVVFSNGWLHCFKIRMGLAHYVFHGEAASAPMDRIDDERYRLVSMIAWYAAYNVYNCDETALPWCLVANSGLAFGFMPGLKLDNKRLSYLLCTNQNGTDKRDPLTIGRAKKNTLLWRPCTPWLSDLNEDMRHQNRHILLLCDNAPSHKHNNDDYSNVRVEPMIPNVTAWLQPMDGGIIASFKAHYRHYFIRHALRQNERGVTAENMYKVNQLDGMRMALAAWNSVTPQTIQNCWRHVGLVPSTPPFYGPPPPAPPELAHTDHLHGYIEPNQPMWDDYNPQIYLLPEDAAALDQFDTDFETEGVWSDAEIAALYRPGI